MKFFIPMHVDPEPKLNQIEVFSVFQIPSFHIIGLPSREIEESKERIRSAILASGFEFPKRRVIVNLSPASEKKRGTSSDLGIALSILFHQRKNRTSFKIASSGELSLDGRIQPAGRITRTVYSAVKNKLDVLFVSSDEIDAAKQALGLIYKAEKPKKPLLIVSVKTLRSTYEAILKIGTLKGKEQEKKTIPLFPKKFHPPGPSLNLCPMVYRSLLTSIVGFHHILLLGPKGSGKSHALEWFAQNIRENSPGDQLAQILMQELIEPEFRSNLRTPVRRVGMQTRPGALLGSSRAYRFIPGEFALAHGGIMVADEFPEWPRDSKESLREPLETGICTLTRGDQRIRYPSRFLFAGTGNFCPCGGVPKKYKNGNSLKYFCRCTPHQAQKYRDKISGPILDRIDIFCAVLGESPIQRDVSRTIETIQESILQAKTLWGKQPGSLSLTDCESIIKSHPTWRTLPEIQRSQGLRCRHKILRIALTLGLIDRSGAPMKRHFTEAFYMRPEQNLIF